MLKDLNETAQKRFNDLRSKLQLDIQKPIIEKAITLTQEKIDNMLDPDDARQTLAHAVGEASDAANIVDDTFTFIDSLRLPPELSLAIGLIISGNKTNKLLDIENARLTLKKYLYERGFDAKREETSND